MFFYQDKHVNNPDVIVDYVELRHRVIVEIYEILLKLNFPTAELNAYIQENGLNKEVKKIQKQTTFISPQSVVELSPVKKNSVQKIKSEMPVRKDTTGKVEAKQVLQTAMSFLSDMQVATLKNYGMERDNEIEQIQAGKILPTKAELTLMLYKVFVEADTENRKVIREIAAARKLETKKKNERKAAKEKVPID